MAREIVLKRSGAAAAAEEREKTLLLIYIKRKTLDTIFSNIETAPSLNSRKENPF